MKIGIVTTWFERGAAYVSLQYKKILENEGHEVFIYERGGERKFVLNSKWTDSDVYHGKNVSFPESTYIDLKDFDKWLDETGVETVFFNEQRWLKPVIFCKNKGIKVGAYIDYYTKDTVGAFGLYDFLICNTKRHHSVFKDHPQSYFIPWGTNVDLYKGDGREKSEYVRFFISVGMSPYRKGVDLLIKSFILLVDNSDGLKSKLIIHTQVSLDEFVINLGDEIFTRYKALIKSNHIKIISETVSAPGLYHLGDIYVYPTRLEGIGLTICEAISSGMPVIVPDDAPMNELLPLEISKIVKIEKYFERYDGYYWESNEVNIDYLEKAMMFYLDNKTQLEKYESKARDFAKDNLDWFKSSKVINDIFINTEIIELNLKQKKWIKFNNNFNKKIPLISQFELPYKLIWGVFKK